MNKVKLSPYQLVFYYEQQLVPIRYDYNITFIQKIIGPLDVQRLSRALTRLVLENIVYKSIVAEKDEDFYWQESDILPKLEIISSSSKKDIEKYIKQPFNLNTAPPCRFALFTQKEYNKDSNNINSEYILVAIFHHIVMDGAKNSIFSKISKYYNDNSFREDITIEKQKNILNANSVKFENVIKKQKSKSTAYWKKYTINQTAELKFAETVIPDKIETYTFDFSLQKDYSNWKKTLNFESSDFNILLTAFAVLTARYSGEEHIAISYPVTIDKRDILYLGTAINTVPACFHLEETQSFKELLKKRNVNFIGEIRNSKLPIYDILNNTPIKSQHISFAQTNLKNEAFSFKNCKTNVITDSYLYDIAGDSFSLEYEMGIDDNINFRIKYKNIYSHEFIKSLSINYLNVLKQCLKNPELPLFKIQTCSPEEYKKVIYSWNKTDASFPTETTIHTIFEEQTLLTPNKTAVVFNGKKITYKSLNRKADQLAAKINTLFKKNTNTDIQNNLYIPVCMDKNTNVIISLLAILKAGGIYVPIDPNLPDSRINFILNDTSATVVITQTNLSERIKKLNQKIHCISLDNDIIVNDKKIIPSKNNIIPDSSAYVIYTSGSTGTPKGVVIKHRSIANMLYDRIQQYDFKVDERVMLFNNYIFDASLEQIFLGILTGATLYIPTEKTLTDTNLLEEYLADNKITHLDVTPSYLSLLSPTETLSLKRIVVGGDICPKSLLKKWNKNYKFINNYGPTEATINSSTAIYEKNTIDPNVTIGKAILNYNLFILDKHLNPTPVNVPGELFIGGIGLASEYLNNPKLTAESFVSNPFANKSDKEKGYTKLYKTGDLCCRLSDGNIKFIGRIDNQIKIRGYRIELGEIESVLSRYENIENCTVIARKEDGNNKYLIAYYTIKKSLNNESRSVNLNYNSELENQKLKDILSNELPEYMIPDIYIKLDKFPLNTSGKIDKNTLPNYDIKEELSSEYIPPVTKQEKEIAIIWQNLLGIKKIGISDDFFKIGGNSILAIRISNKMSTALKANVSVSDFFKYKNIKDIIRSSYSNDSSLNSSINEYKGKYPALSFAQERLFFIESFTMGTSAYNIPICLELNRQTDLAHFKRCIQKIVDRHSILRTIIKEDAKYNLYQYVSNDKFAITEKNITTQELQKELDIDTNTHFNLKEKLPIKVWIYKLSDGSIKALINIHHIAFDGWSVDIFIKELEDLYRNKKLPSLHIQYKDYAVWQREYLDKKKQTEQLTYWKDKLKNYETLNLPIDKIRPSSIDYKGNNVKLKINNDLSSKLLTIAKQNGVSLFTVLLAGFKILLSKYCCQEDITIGTPSANRDYPQTDKILGFFVNNLVLRDNISPEKTTKNIIKSIFDNITKTQKYQDLPFEKIVECLNEEKQTSKHPIFQVMFSTANFNPITINWLLKQLPDSYPKTAKFDLNLSIDESKESFECNFNYATSIFKQATIERLALYYNNILDQIADNIDLKIKNIQLLPQSEYEKIIFDWNKTEASYPKNQTIHELFESQVEKTPNNTALIFKDKKITYHELNIKVNQLVHKLRSEYELYFNTTIKPNTLFGIYADKSIEMIAAVFAVLKIGGAYVPLDKADPDERLIYKIKDCKCRIILTTSDRMKKIKSLCDSNILFSNLDTQKEASLKEENTNPKNIYSPINLAYIIYTSGSTGTPRGVMIQHRSLTNYLQWMKEYSNITSNDTIGFTMAFSFDGAVPTYLIPLLTGASVSIPPENVTDNTKHFADYISETGITILRMTPSYFELFAKIKSLSDTKLRLIIPGGEKLNGKTAFDFMKDYPSIKVLNHYGPTEATIGCICNNLPTYSSPKETEMLGKPGINRKIYILDKNMNPVPIGIIGELYIGGAGLAKGYLNEKDLTDKKFINNPFATTDDRKNDYLKIYKTGDLCKWLPDGNIIFAGRNDDQIKIRGYRVELGEIETILSEHTSINQCSVLCREHNGNKYLIAYYTENETADLTVSKQVEVDKAIKDTELQSSSSQPVNSTQKLKDFLSVKIPDYMIPNLFIKMDKMPLNTSGKINTKALPEQTFKINNNTYVPASTETEKQLTNIWQDIIGINKIGINDNFFKLGGNSILSIKLINSINEHFGTSLPLITVFKHPDIENIAKQINIIKSSLDKSKGYSYEI